LFSVRARVLLAGRRARSRLLSERAADRTDLRIGLREGGDDDCGGDGGRRRWTSLFAAALPGRRRGCARGGRRAGVPGRVPALGGARSDDPLESLEPAALGRMPSRLRSSRGHAGRGRPRSARQLYSEGIRIIEVRSIPVGASREHSGLLGGRAGGFAALI
jgi:hypothetical protein